MHRLAATTRAISAEGRVRIMTEQEAVKILKSDSCWGCPSSSGSAANCTYGACRMSEATRKAIAALEEIQQYRAIGTVKKCQEYKEITDGMNAVDMAALCIAMSRLKKYQNIGTVEECREAVEMQRIEERPLDADENGLSDYWDEN